MRSTELLGDIGSLDRSETSLKAPSPLPQVHAEDGLLGGVVRLLKFGFLLTAFSIGVWILAVVTWIAEQCILDVERWHSFSIRFSLQMLTLLRSTGERLGLVSTKIEELWASREGGPYVLVSNHPTIFDALFLIPFFPNAVCLAKPELLRHWRYRQIIRALKYLPAGTSPHLFDECVNAIAEGRSVFIFPEGTRSRSGAVGELRRGAAVVALRSGVPLVPIVIRADPPTFHKSAGTSGLLLKLVRQIPHKQIDFRATVHYPIFPKNNLVVGEKLQSQELTRRLQQLFHDELGSNG